MSKSRAQSPCTVREYPPSPLKHRSITHKMNVNKRKQEGERGDAGTQHTREEEAGDNKLLEKTTIKPLTPDEKILNKKTPEKKVSKVETLERRTSKAETPEKASKAETPEKAFKADTPEKGSKAETPEKKTSKAETFEKNTWNVETSEKKMAKSSSSDLSGDRSAGEALPVCDSGSV